MRPLSYKNFKRLQKRIPRYGYLVINSSGIPATPVHWSPEAAWTKAMFSFKSALSYCSPKDDIAARKAGWKVIRIWLIPKSTVPFRRSFWEPQSSQSKPSSSPKGKR